MPPQVLEVRGEVYMTNADLADLNVRQRASGTEPFKNTRNVTAGTIRLLDPAIAAERNLRFFCHGVGETEGLKSKNHIEFLAEIGRWAFHQHPMFDSCRAPRRSWRPSPGSKRICPICHSKSMESCSKSTTLQSARSSGNTEQESALVDCLQVREVRSGHAS